MRKRDGAALLLALWLIVVVGLIAAGVARASRNESRFTLNLRASTIARYSAESGVVYSVASIERTLSTNSDSAVADRFLNSLQTNPVGSDALTLGSGRFSVVFVDLNSRLDVNAATIDQLSRLFRFFTDAPMADAAAAAIREHIERRGAGVDASDFSRSRPDLRYPPLTPAAPLMSLEELRGITGVPEKLAADAAPYLTVDGDGRINRVSASDTVLSVAAGSLVDAPTRLLVISRGWQNNEKLTHEIQAVYAIEDQRLVLVRWRERQL